MPTMTREAWTDERLDDLNKKVDDGFAAVDKRFDKVDARLLEMYRVLVGAAAVIIATLLGTLLS
jgi:tetrahydromethanopterin S-methyltransferase subunit G